MTSLQAEVAFLAALKKGDISECTSLSARNPLMLIKIKELRELFYEAIRLGNKEVLAYWFHSENKCYVLQDALNKFKTQMLDYCESVPNASEELCTEILQSQILQTAIKSHQLEIIRYCVDELKFSTKGCPYMMVDPLIDALNAGDNAVTGYILNQVEFFTENLRYYFIADRADGMSYPNNCLRSFVFSKEAMQRLFTKSPKELCAYFHILADLPDFTVSKNFDFKALDLTHRLKLLSRLLQMEIDNPADLEFLIQMQVSMTNSLQDETLSAEQTQALEVYNISLKKRYGECMTIINNPFNEGREQDTCLRILELSNSHGRLGAAQTLPAAHKVIIARLIKLIEDNQGDVQQHLERLNVFAAKRVKEAVVYITSRNTTIIDKLFIKASTTNSDDAEQQLRMLAKNHLYAQLQLAKILITQDENRVIKLFSKAKALEAKNLIFANSLLQFPDTYYYRGICLEKGIGCTVSVVEAMFQYFLAAKNKCDLAVKRLKQYANSAREPQTQCHAGIYNSILSLSHNPHSHNHGFANLATSYPNDFIRSMFYIAEEFLVTDQKIILLQIALEFAKPGVETAALEDRLTSYLMQLNTKNSHELYDFALTVSALTADRCAKYALRFVYDKSLSENIRQLWVIAAEMKLLAIAANSESQELQELQKCLAVIGKEEQKAMRISMQVGKQIIETKSYSAPTNEKPVETPLVDTKPLQTRLDQRGFTGEIPDYLKDPCEEHIMSEPGACEDGFIYDKITFTRLKNKTSPFKPHLVLQQFIPLQQIQDAAVQFVEKVEQSSPLIANNSATSTSSIKEAIQAGVTHFTAAPPSAPPMQEEVLVLAVVSNNDDDDGEAITYPSAPDHALINTSVATSTTRVELRAMAI